MMKNIVGDLVSLRPLTEDDRDSLFRWATQSKGTQWWYSEEWGEEIPSREKFFDDWKDFYFNDTAPEKGRSFAIVVNREGREIGQINYQVDEEENDPAVFDIDILIARSEDISKGYGTGAIRLLTGYLKSTFPVSHINMYSLPGNQRAIRSFNKSGFTVIGEIIDKDGHKALKLKKYITPEPGTNKLPGS